MFFKNPPMKSAFQKILFSCYDKIKIILKGHSPKTAFYRINNKINKILTKYPRKSPFPPKQQTYSL